MGVYALSPCNPCCDADEETGQSHLPDSDIYCIGGGHSGGIPFGDMERWDGAAWNTASDLPSPVRSQNSASQIGTKLYTTNGTNDEFSSSGAELLDHDQFDTVATTWTNKSNHAPRSKAGSSDTIDDTNLYAMGGIDTASPTKYYKDTDLYNQVPDSWTAKTDMPPPGRWGHGSWDLLSTIYLSGGHDGSSYLSDLDSYVDDTWTGKTGLPSSSRRLHGTFVLANKGYCAYGEGAANQPCDEYTPGSDSWSAKTSPGGSTKSRVCSESLDDGSDTSGHIIYGVTTVFQTQHSSYDDDTDSWTGETAGPSPARAFGGTAGV